MQKKKKDVFFYYDLFHYPEKIKKTFDLFGRANVKVILLDDIIDNPKETMKTLFHFLGVDSIEQDYSVENKGLPLLDHTKLKVRYFYFLHYLSRYIKNKNSDNSFVKSKIVRNILLFMLRILLTFVRHPYNTANSQAIKIKPNRHVYELMAKEFASDIDELSILLERDLHSWHVYENNK